jgi:hypothetical protein
MVDVGDERLMPMEICPALQPRFTAVMCILHHHKAAPPEPKKPIRFLLKVTDHRNRSHLARLSVQAR